MESTCSHESVVRDQPIRGWRCEGCEIVLTDNIDHDPPESAEDARTQLAARHQMTVK